MQKLSRTSVVLPLFPALTLPLVLMALLAGCGQKGPLALQPAAGPASAAAPAAQR